MALEGPPATESLSYHGATYSYRLDGRMDDRKVCLEVAAGCYAVTAAADGGLAIEGLPEGAPLPQVLPKGQYADLQTRHQGFVDVLYLALALIIMGVGFLKANISSIVGQLYDQGDPRRDPGFTLYYYGINLGRGLGLGPLRGGRPVDRLVRGLRARRVRHAGRLPRLRVQQAAARGQGRAAEPGGAGEAHRRPALARMDPLSRRAGRGRPGLAARPAVRAHGRPLAGRLGCGAGLSRLSK